MRVEFFQEQLAKMQNFYGKEYNEMQAEEIFKYFAKFPDKRFTYILSKAYQEIKFLPSLSELVAINKDIPYTELKEKTKGKVKCDYCKGSGIILYYKKINGYDYEFASYCSCENGDEYHYDGSKNTTRKKTDYYIPSAAALGLI